jgi:hypothetical protein
MLRNRVLQQRNFLKLLDHSLGPFSRFVARLSLATGLFLRAVIRGVHSLTGTSSSRLAFQAELSCLADFIGTGRSLPGDNHAHRT